MCPKHEEGEIDNESSKSKRPMEVDGSAIASDDKRTKTSDDFLLPPGWISEFSKSHKKMYYSHPSSKHTQWHFPTTSEARDPVMAKNRLQQATATATEVERVKENARLDTERLELENKQLRLDTENAINKVRLLEDNVAWLEEKARIENGMARLHTERLELENKQLRLVTENATNATNDVERLKHENEKLQCILKRAFARKSETDTNESVTDDIADPVVSPLSSQNKNTSPSTSSVLDLTPDTDTDSVDATIEVSSTFAADFY